MTYDLKAYCRDLQDRLNWLFKEAARLQEENQRLQQENKQLREEVTLARLFRDMEPSSENPMPSEDVFDLPASISSEAMEFFQTLPHSFSFADFFKAAETADVPGDLARDYMLLFFRENMLQQKGRRIEKTDQAPSSVRLAQ